MFNHENDYRLNWTTRRKLSIMSITLTKTKSEIIICDNFHFSKDDVRLRQKKITDIGWRGLRVYYEILVSVPRESV